MSSVILTTEFVLTGQRTELTATTSSLENTNDQSSRINNMQKSRAPANGRAYAGQTLAPTHITLLFNSDCNAAPMIGIGVLFPSQCVRGVSSYRYQTRDMGVRRSGPLEETNK